MAKIYNAPQEIASAIDLEEGALDTTNGGKENAVANAGDSGGKPMIVHYNVICKLAVAVFLTAAGCHAIPNVYLDTPNADFQYCSIFFMLGTGFLLISAIIDFVGKIGNGVVVMSNSFLHILAAATLEAGSISLYPGLNKSGEPLAQYLFLAGTCVVCFAILWVSIFRVCCIMYYVFQSSHSCFNFHPSCTIYCPKKSRKLHGSSIMEMRSQSQSS